MCYNKEVSMTSFIIGGGLSTLLYTRGDKYDKHIASLFFFVTLIQLAEYFIWIDQDCGEINNFASNSISVILFFQAFVSVMGGYYFNTYDKLFSNKYLKYILLTSMVLYGIITFLDYRDCCTKETTEGHLEWELPRGNVEDYSIFIRLLYYICLFLPWLLIKDTFKGRLLFALIFFSFLYFRFNFDTWESYWCLYSIAAPVIFLNLHIFKK